MLAPLKTPRDHWRSRWLQFSGGEALHRVSVIAWEDGEMIRGTGTTVCGARGRLLMPGIFSRMGAPRCAHCCRALGLPRGEGAPFNTLKGKQQNA